MSNCLEEIFGVKKPIIGMAHLLPLPGSYLYDDSKGMTEITENILEDVEKLQSGGVHGIMFCNEHDRPYALKVKPSIIAAVSSVISEVKSHLRVPFGVDILWDPIASLGVAKATGAEFIREIFTGTFSGDMGLWLTDCNETFLFRKLIKAENIKMFFNINAEFSGPIDNRPLSVVTKSVIMSSLPDALLVSGPTTGMVAKMDAFKEIKKEAEDVPVLANTGVNVKTVKDILNVVDGAIIGTAFKQNGVTWNPIDEARVKEIMDKVNS